MKKFLAVFIAMAILVACVPAMADGVSFWDMPADHWAMANVTRLVLDGTINGMPDGSFNPTGIVTRAEFVKMLGKSDVRFTTDFSDVPMTHWAYGYVMYSQLDGDENGKFNPDTPITRGDAAGLLYKRFGGGNKERAPYAIWHEASTPEAASWVYNTGLMVGSDYVNLRLTDTLTRAEAATLIVRAKDLKYSDAKLITENFSDETYKNIYENSGIFDSAYDPSGNITYEELAIAAMRFQYKYKTPAIAYKFSDSAQTPNEKYWDVAVNYALDEKGTTPTKQNAMKYATVEDALAILSLGAQNSMYPDNVKVNVDGKTYRDVTIKDVTSNFAKRMSFAYNFGIVLGSSEYLGAKSLATKKDVSKILLQYTLTYGSQRAYHCGYNAKYLTPYTRLNAPSYPSNRDYYSDILEDVPNFVYEAPFETSKPVKDTPRDYTSTATALGSIYATSVMEVSAAAYEKGADIYFDYYPSLTARLEDMSGVFRVKVTVEKTFDGMKLSDIMPLGKGVSDRLLTAGESFWCDISTNHPIIGVLYIDYTKLTMDKIIG